jgi:hypothetical protein
MTIPDYDICDCGIIGPHSKCRLTWPDSHITYNCVYTAWDESQSIPIGHFPIRQEAREALKAYAKTLNQKQEES